MWESTRVCKYGACDFLLRKNGCGIPFGSAAAFSLHRRSCNDPPAWVAPAVQSAAQLNIAYWHGKVIRSESGTTVHCCVSTNASVRKPAVPIGFITL